MARRAAQPAWFVPVLVGPVAQTAQPGLHGTPLPTADMPWWAFVAIVLGLIIVAVVAFFWLRRITKYEEAPPARGFFSLVDLRRLRDAGELSAEEYEKLRDLIRIREMERPPPSESEEDPPNRLR